MASSSSISDAGQMTLEELCNRQTITTLQCFDFSEMTSFPFRPNVEFERYRVNAVAVGMKLYELQAMVRVFQEKLELEAASFKAVHQSILLYFSKRPGSAPRVFNTLFGELSAKLAKAFVGALDPNNISKVHDIFDFKMCSQWGMPDSMKEVFDANVVSDSLLEIDQIKTLNAAMNTLMRVSFITSYHYSAAMRRRYTIPFEKIISKCLQLSKLPILPWAAAYLFADTQSDSKKRSLIIQKCTSLSENERLVIEKSLGERHDRFKNQMYEEMLRYIELPDDVDYEHDEAIEFVKELMSHPANEIISSVRKGCLIENKK